MDRHIDNHETQTYGPKLRQNLASAFESSPPQVRTFLAWLIEQQADADGKMAEGVSSALGAAADLTRSAMGKAPAAEGARGLLVGLHSHLGSKRQLGEWSGDPKLFFPRGVSGVGTTPSSIATALDVARKAFKKDRTVPEAKKLDARLAAAEKKLLAELAASTKAIAADHAGKSARAARKTRWLATYRGISLIAEGLLTLEGRPEALRTVVPHLAVSGGAKKKAGAKGKGGGAGGGAPAP